MTYVNSVSVYPKTITLQVGTWSYDAYAEICPPHADCKEVRWHSDNACVASVNESSGYIYGNAVGTTTIYATATDGSGCSDCLTVTVQNTVPVASITLSNSTIYVEEGETYPIFTSVLPENATDKGLNWTSSNNSIATVSDGVVTAISQGTATIYATARDGSGKSAHCTVNVTKNILVSSIRVEPEEISMNVDELEILHVTVEPENATNQTVEWSSDNPYVATVDPERGIVHTMEKGSTIIRATAQDGSGVVGTCNITVNLLVQEIALGNTGIELHVGELYTLNAVVFPTNASNKDLCWRSDKPHIASVDDTGKITAKAVGSTIIFVEAKDGSGVSSVCVVSVIQTPAEETPENKVPGSTFADPVDVYTGAHMLTNTIMSLFGGQGVKLALHYDSNKLVRGMFGIGWYHNFEKRIEINDGDAYVYNNPSTYSHYVCSDYVFADYQCQTPGKNGYHLNVDLSREYPYVIDCNSERHECYNADGYLAKIIDHQGFETLITNSGYLITITDTVSGKSIYLQKNSLCRVVRIYDDFGREATLSYTGNLLTSITDVNGNAITYQYDENNRIVSSVDSRNICYFENTYDNRGRVLTQKDAMNNTSYFEYIDESNENYEAGTRITTNRSDKKSYRFYNTKGLLTKYKDENGNETAYEYDENCNVIKETDANGNSVIKTYNGFNKPTQITNREGNTTYFTYDNKGNVKLIEYFEIDSDTYPVERFEYNNRNQIIEHTDIRGIKTAYTYDENGMPATKTVKGKNHTPDTVIAKNPTTYSYENGLLKSQTDPMGNTTSYAHNAIGQVISKTDADNKVTTYEYDKSGNLLKTIDANGKSIINTYDGNYQKTYVTDANGNTTYYSYNGNMKNDVIVFPDNSFIQHAFDAEDRVISVTDQQYCETIFTYDDAGRMISKRLPDGALIQYEYDKVGNVIKETNPKGAIVTKTYDKLGNVLTVTDDEGNTTNYEYNEMNKVTKVTNAANGATVYEYSKAGELLSETDALGNKKTYTYDEYGNRASAKDARNNVTTYTYDQNNNLLTIKDPLNHVTTYTYNALNQCVSVKDALDNVINYGYDALGRRTTITDARGNTFTTTYDGNGNVIKTTDAKGNTISETVYNSLNKPLTVTDAMGKATTYTYNALGKVESVTDSLNHRTEFTYDFRGQNTEVCDAANNTSTATYDLLGNVTSLAGPLGGATNYTYDDMGRLTSESTVSGGTKSYEYNELNVRKKITNARGQIRDVVHDKMGRITSYTSPEGTVSYTYDANGNVLTVTDSHGTIRRTYDALNRVLSYTDTYGKVIRYEYDAVGNLYKLIYPDNTAVTYAYDANHNLKSVTDWANRVTSYTYDENNHVIGVTKPDGSVTTTVYDNKQRVTSTVERTSDDTIITGFEYVYDDLSRIIEEKVLANSTKICYTYDSLSRVTKRTIKNISDDSVISEESFTYDAAGNVTSAPDNSFQYDTNNRLISFNGNAVSYDLDGNMLSNGALTCTYDSANRLTSAGGHTYTYNAEDVRIRNLCADANTTYTYDSNAKLSKLLCKITNGITTKYVYGRGLIGEEKCGEFKTYHFDCRGSTIAITNSSGNITDTFAYDTYGKLISRTGDSFVIFGYNGRDGVVTDKNGLIYMRARYYSPEMRRFINADVVAGSIDNAVTLNRFAYANGNPVSLVDPFGLIAERGVQPTDLEAAYMADHIYTATTAMYDENLGSNFNDWKLKEIYDPGAWGIGLKIGVYYRQTGGKTSYCLVYAGTNMQWMADSDDFWKDLADSASDWINNLIQPIGLSWDQRNGIDFAKQFSKEHSSSNITIIGHSKGGAEAAAAAVATNNDSILFNPASVALDMYGLNAEDYTADMDVYVVEGEILNNIFGWISRPIDDFEYIYYDDGGAVEKHTMDAVISALQ